MTYSTTNPPKCTGQGIGQGSPKFWSYESTDAVTTVRVDGYFSNGWDLGMRKGDIVFVRDTDASPTAGNIHWVTSASSSTGVDLSNGVAITETDSD